MSDPMPEGAMPEGAAREDDGADGPDRRSYGVLGEARSDPLRLPGPTPLRNPPGAREAGVRETLLLPSPIPPTRSRSRSQ